MIPSRVIIKRRVDYYSTTGQDQLIRPPIIINNPKKDKVLETEVRRMETIQPLVCTTHEPGNMSNQIKIRNNKRKRIKFIMNV